MKGGQFWYLEKEIIVTITFAKLKCKEDGIEEYV